MSAHRSAIEDRPKCPALGRPPVAERSRAARRSKPTPSSAGAEDDRVVDPPQRQDRPAALACLTALRIVSCAIRKSAAARGRGRRRTPARRRRANSTVDLRDGLRERLHGRDEAVVVEHEAVQPRDGGTGLVVGQVGERRAECDLGLGLPKASAGSSLPWAWALRDSSAALRWKDIDASAVVTPSCRSKAIRRRSVSWAEIAWAMSRSRSLPCSSTASMRRWACSRRPSRSA